ncbi:MAG: Cof-type HAD-IIB family hydrolase [Defluviitaleaceae bacterium]|nr:Cof-type HAD-IIB family hydrolase [Defluviitaleaceae bacterium]
MNIKMIVMDLDGTLLRSDKTISEYTIQALKKCQARGVKIGIATARTNVISQKYVDMMDADFHIYHGGATGEAAGEVLYNKMLDKHAASKVIDTLIPLSELLTCEAACGYFYNEHHNHVDRLESNGLRAIQTNFSTWSNIDVFKISAKISKEDACKIVDGIDDVEAIPFHGELEVRFAHKDATKLKALEAVAGHYNISLASIAAFGDDYNDVEMLAACGYGVAMANGIDLAKDAAKFVTFATNDEDGVAKWLEENVG